MKRVLLGALSLMLACAALLLYLHGIKAISPAKDITSTRLRLSVDADKVLEGFNQVCTELHLPAMTPTVPPIRMDVDNDEFGTGRGPTIKLSDGASYEFTFLQADDSLTWYSDNQLFNSLYESYAPYYDKPDEPKWTKEQAIQVGNSFLKVLTPQIKMKLGEAKARFDQQYSNSKYHVGRWMIQWPRVDSKGNFFSDDDVIMEIPEGHSPVLVQIKQSTSYSEEKGEPMKMEQALEKVRSKIASDKFWDKAKSVFPWHYSEGWTDAKPIGAYLQIVCPEHQKKSPARLAWVFWFHKHP